MRACAKRLWFVSALALVASGCVPGRGETQPSLLLITVDTLRADRLGAYGSAEGLTPHLDRLAGESIVFERAYAPASFTVPAISSAITGRYPEQNAIFSNESIVPESVPTLAMMLREQGFRTGAVVSNYVLRSGGGLERGFDRYDAKFPQSEAARPVPERIAEETTDAALEMLAGWKRDGVGRRFLWVHYQDPHGPYTPPSVDLEWVEERRASGAKQGRTLPFGKDHRGLGGIPTYQRIGDHAEAEHYIALYDAEVRYTDREIGRLLDALPSNSRGVDWVIAFTADHGEGLGEHDYWFAHGEYLFDPLVRVPLFLRAPEQNDAPRPDVASLVDLLPTLLPLLGITPPTELPGRNLLASAEAGQRDAEGVYMSTLGGSTRPRFGVVSGDLHYLATVGKGRIREHLYRVGDASRDLKGEEPERLTEMRDRLRTFRADLRSPHREQHRPFWGPDREKLKALGYVEDP